MFRSVENDDMSHIDNDDHDPNDEDAVFAECDVPNRYEDGTSDEDKDEDVQKNWTTWSQIIYKRPL